MFKAATHIILVLLGMLCCKSMLGQVATKVLQDSVFIIYGKGVCKNPSPITITLFKSAVSKPIVKERSNRAKSLVEAELMYQHFFRNSASENLFVGDSKSDLVTLQVRVLYKGQLPFQTTLRYNKTSPFQLDDQWSIYFGFDQRNYSNVLQQDIKTQIVERFESKREKLLARHRGIYEEYSVIRNWQKSPQYLQESIEARMSYFAKTNISFLSSPTAPYILRELPHTKLSSRFDFKMDSALLVKTISKTKEEIIDSIQTALHTIEKGKVDSLLNRMNNIEDSITLARKEMNRSIDSLNQELSGISSTKELLNYAKNRGLDGVKNKGAIASILTNLDFRLGRFLVNQSQLTVSNIFLKGISVKYGDRKFISLTAGRYDFAFRNVFQFRNDSLRSPGSNLFAIKVGKQDNVNLSAFNFFIGQKRIDGTIGSPLKPIAGYSYEKKFEVSRNLLFNFEIAKSTPRFPEPGKADRLLKSLFTDFQWAGIGSYASMDASITRTRTDISLDYQYFGSQFESFNASRYYNPQNKVSAKISQTLFKRKLHVLTGLRYADFKTYGIASNMKAKTLLGYGTAIIRLKKAPILTVGYYPGSQLYWIDNSKLYEYFYYILNANLTHSFAIKRLSAHISLAYNKFFNTYVDSVIDGSQKYYSAQLTVYKNKLTGSIGFSHQEILNSYLRVFETGIVYGAERFRASGAFKFNFTNTDMKLGYSFGIGLKISRFGNINMHFDKSFLPERLGNVIPVTSGQVQLIKPLKFRL